MSMEKRIDLRVDAVHNKQQTDRVDMKRRDGGVLRMVQCDNGKDG